MMIPQAPRAYEAALRHRSAAVVLLTAVLIVTGGCATHPNALDEVYRQYGTGRFHLAYRYAKQVIYNTNNASEREEATLMAGMAAYKLKNMAAARRYLEKAGHSEQPDISGDAHATIGLMHIEAGRYNSAHQSLVKAGRLLNGNDRARAFFFAGVTLQKLGRWSEARRDLTRAEAAATERTLRRRIAREKENTAWALQTGAFASRQRAKHEQAKITQRIIGLELGPAVVILAVNDKGQTIYLVQIGRFNTYALAVAARGQLGLPKSDPVAVPK